jgi:putative transposase
MLYRKTTRLQGYDYGSEGLYFITILIRERQKLLGEVVAKELENAPKCERQFVTLLSSIGRIVDEEWRKTTLVRENIIIHDYVIMPDHLHGILEITENRNKAAQLSVFQSPSQTIGAIVRGFKTAVIKKLKEAKLANEYPILFDWEYKIWHRNYHDRIIKDEASFIACQNYIFNNPRKWYSRHESDRGE